MENSPLTDKVVVITGASSGIGAALARQVGARGGVPVLVARREKELAEAAAQCGPRAISIIADVTKRADHTRIVETTLARAGRIDAWVNNAGRGITRLPSQLTEEEIDDIFLVNVKSVFYGMQAVLPHFQERNAGHIINVSSLLGRVPWAHFRSAYCASKSYVNTLTATLRLELAQSHPGIAVTVFHPGVVATDFGQNSLHGGVDSRKIPGAQDVEEVGAALAECLAHPSADVYSRPEYRAQIAAYYAAEDLGALEKQMAQRR